MPSPTQVALSFGNGTGNSHSATFAGALAGDVVLVALQSASGFAHPATTATWKQEFTTVAGAGGDTTRQSLYSHVVQTGETTFTIPFGGNVNYEVGFLLYRNISTTAPVVATATSAVAGTGSGSQTFATPNTTVAVDQVVLLVCSSISVAAFSCSIGTSSANWTKNSSSAGTPAGQMGIFTGTPPALGAFTGATITVNAGGGGSNGTVSTDFVLSAPSAAQTVGPAAIGSGGAMGTPAVTAQNHVSPTGIVSSGAVGVPTVTRRNSISPTGIVSSGAMGTPTVTAAVVVSPVGIASAGAVGTPTVVGPRTLRPSGIPSAGVVGTAVIVAGPLIDIGIPSAEAFGHPTVSGALKPSSIPSRESFGTLKITGGYHRYDFVPPGSPQSTTNGVTRDFPINVSGLGSIKDAEVSLYMTNPGGLAGNQVTLIAPTGQSVVLIPTNKGGTQGATGRGTADQDRTQFDSEAAKAWGSLADAPWVGRFRPSGSLASLNGLDPNGRWVLRIADKKQGNTVNTIRVATLLLDTVLALSPQTVSPPSIPSAGAVGTLTIAGPVSPSSIPSAGAVGQPVIQQTPGNQFAVIFGLAIASGTAFGTPTVVGPITPTAITSGGAVGTPTVDAGVAASQPVTGAGGITGGAMGTPVVTTTPTVIHPVGIPSSTTFGGGVGAVGVVVSTRPPPGVHARRASFLLDPLTGAYYEWPINHDTEEAVALGRTITPSAPRLDVGVARGQSADEPPVLRLSGVALDRAQIDQLDQFYDRCGLSPAIFHDADGDEYEVVITQFGSHRIRGRNPHGGAFYWRYTIQLEVVHVRSGAYVGSL